MHFGKLKTNTLLHGLWIQLTYNDPDIGICARASYMQQCVKLNTVTDVFLLFFFVVWKRYHIHASI